MEGRRVNLRRAYTLRLPDGPDPASAPRIFDELDFAVNAVGIDHESVDACEQLRLAMGEMRRECEAVESFLAEEFDAHDETARELEICRRQLEQRSIDLAQRDTEMEMLRTAAETRAESPQASPSQQGDLSAAQQRIAELIEERDALEDELAQVRALATSTDDQIEAKRRELEEQQTAMSREMRDMRKMLEQQAELLASRAQQPVAAATAPAESAAAELPAATSQPAKTDPSTRVVDDIAAQFSRLQQEAARRRGRK